MDAALERMLNLLLESERAGVTVLDSLAAEVGHPELKELLLDAREDESHNVVALERLVREGGGTPSAATGPFAGKVAAGGGIGRGAVLLSLRPGRGGRQKAKEARRPPRQRALCGIPPN